MRRHKILTRILLILSIINFALPAPVAVRGRPEARLDANVTRNVAATSQKRQDTLDKGESTNVPGPDDAPLPSQDLTDILSQVPYADSPPPTPEHVPEYGPSASPGLEDILSQSPQADAPPQTPDSLPPSPESPTGSPLPVGTMPEAGSLSPPPPPPPHPGSSDDHSPSPSGFSVNPDASPAKGPTGNQPTPLESPDAYPEMHYLLPPSPHPSQPGPSDDRSPSPSSFSVNPDTLPATGPGNQPTPPESPGADPEMHPLLPPSPHWHPSQPGPSSFPVNPDTSPATGPTGNQPISPQSPGAVDPEMHSLLNPEAFPSEFWDDVLKGHLKRRVSGSDALNLVQKDTRSRIF